MIGDELFSVEGRRVLVTGGVRGVGLMIARGLVEAGARVTITSRSASDAGDVAARLSARAGAGTAGPACRGLAAELSTEQGCRALAAAVTAREPQLDVLINNAGIMGGLDRATLDEGSWRDALAINVQAGYFLVRDLLPLLRAGAGDGEPARVINIGSVAGSTPSDLDVFAYSASKAAVHHLTAHLARRLAPEITVNALAPGPCDTRMTAPVLELFREAIVKGVPLRRLVSAPDLVGATIFLASRAGAYVTGAVLPVDGGASTA